MAIDDPNNQNPGEPEGYHEFATAPDTQPKVDQPSPGQTSDQLYTQAPQGPVGLDPSASPNKFLGQTLNALGAPGVYKKTEGDEIELDPLASNALAGGLAGVAAKVAPVVVDMMSPAALEQIAGNEIGSIGSDIGRQTAWRGARPVNTVMDATPTDMGTGTAQKIEQGIANPSAAQALKTDQASYAIDAAKRAKSQEAAFRASKLAKAKKLGYADGGPVAPTGMDSGQNSEPAGYTDFIAPEMQQEQYGTPTQQAITGLEGVAQGIAGPLATGAELATGITTPEAMRGRVEANPGVHGLAELGGFGASMATGVGEAALLERAGFAGLAHLPELGKIGSSAVKNAIEFGIMGAGDETSKMLWGDPSAASASAIVKSGLASSLGGAALGAGVTGVISPLWKATVGARTGGLLKAITDKMGGTGGTPDVINDAIETSGMHVPAEVKAGFSQNPEIANRFQTAMEGIANKDIKVQDAVKTFKKSIQDSTLETFGHTPESIEKMPEISKAEAGKTIGNILEKEYAAKLAPLQEEYKAIDELSGKAKLEADSTLPGEFNPQTPYGMPPEVHVPGTGSQVADKLGTIAGKEGWIGGPEDIQRELNRVLKKLPKLETLEDLRDLRTQIGNNTKSTLPFGMQTPLSRAGSMMKTVLSDAEKEITLKTLGEKAPDMVGRYQAASSGYSKLATLKDALNDRLKIGGSVSGFGKGLREMAATDGESIVKRLSGKGDANLLQVLEKDFPETAQAVKQHHLDSVLKIAADKAPPGESISTKHLFNAIDGMSPELRQFTLNPEAAAKLNSLRALSEALPTRMNPTGAAKALESRLGGLPGSAAAVVAGLLGHNPAYGWLLGTLAKHLGREGPAEVRYALLKFMGSDKPLDVGAFKSMVDHMHNTIQGENILSRASKGVFKESSKELLPAYSMPTESDRFKIEKSLRLLHTNPERLLSAGQDIGHYMPDHGQAAAQMHQNVANYLNSQRPQEDKSSPFDTKSPITSIKKAQWARTLDIAQQPLVVLSHVKNGSLTPQDVISLKSMYPDLYNRLTTKVMTSAMDHAAKGHAVSYKTRMGLSLLTGQPMDSTFSPMLIQAAQPKASHVPQDAQSASPMGGSPKHSTNSLNKLPGAYRTPSQAREQKAASEKH